MLTYHDTEFTDDLLKEIVKTVEKATDDGELGQKARNSGAEVIPLEHFGWFLG